MPKKNKPRWKDLNMYERIARRSKQRGSSEFVVNYFHEKAKEKEQEEKRKVEMNNEEILRDMICNGEENAPEECENSWCDNIQEIN